MKTLFLLTEDDAQHAAIESIGRTLTEDELHHVRKGLESGLECWEEIMRIAIDDATSPP